MYKFCVRYERVVDGTEDEKFRKSLLSSSEITLHRNWEYVSFTVDPDIKSFYPEYGSTSTLDTWVFAKRYGEDEFFSLVQDSDGVTCVRSCLEEEIRTMFPKFRVIKEIDYVKIVKDMEAKGYLTTRESTNYLSTSGLKFSLGEKEYEVDCLGTTMFRDLTEEIIKRWKNELGGEEEV